MSSLFFVSVFDRLMKFFPSLRSQRSKAITIVLSVLVFSFGTGSIALSTHHKYLPLAVLGIVYGVLLSYPATQLMGPKFQSALGGALGGFSMGNMVHRINHTISSIELMAQWIATAINQILVALQLPPQEVSVLTDGIVLCLAMAIVTMLLIIITNVYLADSGAAPQRLEGQSSGQSGHSGMAQVAGGN
jgi:branched-subunit amino acid transport protein AzlD